MKELFEVLQQFFVGAAYTIFAVGCVLWFTWPGANYYTFMVSLIMATLFLILSLVSTLAR
jgi:hypothetical protein